MKYSNEATSGALQVQLATVTPTAKVAALPVIPAVARFSLDLSRVSSKLTPNVTDAVTMNAIARGRGRVNKKIPRFIDWIE